MMITRSRPRPRGCLVPRLARGFPSALGLFLATIAFIASGAPPAARAGMGPENLVVVVNADSLDSRTVANHYVELRKIPSRNVIFLSDVPEEQVTSLEAFRERILKPLLAEIDARGLSAQVRAVAYSCGFPYAVRIDEHRKRLEDETMKKIFTPVASINGLTFYYRFVMADREEYLSPGSNLYCRMPWERHFVNPFSGEPRELFAEAEAAAKEGRDADAAKIFEQLLEEHPTQAPLGVLAARAHARAGNPEAAIGQLQRAADAGWSSGAALAEDDDLSSLAQLPEFQQLVDSLGDKPNVTQHPVGFEAVRGWTANGWWVRPDRGGVSYLPAFMLAVTRGEGTTVDSAVETLRRAAEADHTYPDGTVYLASTSDVRTTTRKPQFVEAMLYLKWLDRPVQVVSGKLPQGKSDVIGVTFGTARFDWIATSSTFLPGALADNLTSTGGVMHSPGQTKLTELLKGGAAAASGTVTEPYALQFKFPLPHLHAYYAEGLTAIESFYLSVANPYQLLLVGDPLCQPFARPPAEVAVAAASQSAGTNGITVRIGTPRETDDTASRGADGPVGTDDGDATDERSTPLGQVEFYLDGRLVQQATPQPAYQLRLDGVGGGALEVRTVLVGGSPMAPRKTFLSWMELGGLLPTPSAEVVAASSSDEGIVVEVEAVGADSIRLMHYEEEVGRIDGESGRIEMDRVPLGEGPLRFRPVADVRGTEVWGREFVVP